MNLVLSVEALAPKLTGIGRYTWELVQHLSKHREVESLRYFRGGRWIADPEVLLGEPAASMAGDGVPVLGGRKIKMPRWIRGLELKYQCRKSLFHGPNYFLPPCADIGVITVHDLSVFKYPETHPIERIRQFEKNFASSVDRASHLITDSEATKQEVSAFLGWSCDRVTAVPLGVSNRFGPHLGEALDLYLKAMGLIYGGYILCVSTLEPRKNIDKLLQAYRALPGNLKKRFPLIVAGSRGWLSDNLHKQMERCAAEGSLRYLDFVPDADLPLLFAGAGLFVFPSAYEGFGLPVLEAMASGIPVVASNRSSLPEVTQGTGLHVNPDDIDALAAAIEKGLCDIDWRAKVRVPGLMVAREHSWEKCIEGTVSVYRRCTG